MRTEVTFQERAIRSAMGARGIRSVAQLAELARMSAGYCGQILHGLVPGEKARQAIATVLGVAPEKRKANR